MLKKLYRVLNYDSRGFLVESREVVVNNFQNTAEVYFEKDFESEYEAQLEIHRYFEDTGHRLDEFFVVPIYKIVDY